MNRIETLHELKARKKFLELQCSHLEQKIKNDFKEFKSELEPLKILTQGATNAVSSEGNGLLGGVLGHLAEFLTKDVLLKKSGFLMRLIVPFLVKNTTSNLVEENKPKIMDWIVGMLSKFGSKNPAEETNATG